MRYDLSQRRRPLRVGGGGMASGDGGELVAYTAHSVYSACAVGIHSGSDTPPADVRPTSGQRDTPPGPGPDGSGSVLRRTASVRTPG